MKAIIFNSGIGKRMGEFTQNNHKSMAVLSSGETIFHRQIRVLSECGIRDFLITTGPFADQLKGETEKAEFSHLHFTFVQNPVYDQTNYIYSMYLAREHFNDDCLLLHGDLVFNKALIKKYLADESKDLGLVNQAKALPEKDFKARIVDGCIHEVSIHIFDENCFAFQPLYKLSKETLLKWTEKVEEFIDKGVDQVYAENAFNEILPTLAVKMYSYADDYADEVDNLDDLARVSKEIRQFDFAEQEIYWGKGEYERIPEILSRAGAVKPMVVCDSVFDLLFISKYIRQLPYEFVYFDAFSPNPKYDEVEAGVELFKKENCDFILSVGGGSAIDTAKNIKLFSVMEKGAPYIKQPYGYSPIFHLAIPTTAGTGSESTHFSVVYYEGEKQSVAKDCLLPEAVILEPTLLETLPDYQKKSTLLDALCQCIEATWSVNTTPKCRSYALEGMKLILANYKAYLAGDKDSCAGIIKAANLGGKSINISQTTAAHAMSYKLTSLYRAAHGHAVAVCLPAVWGYMLANQEKVNPALPEGHLAQAFAAYAEAFGVDTPQAALEAFKKIVTEMALPEVKLAGEEDLDTLVASVNPQRLGNNPVALDGETIRQLYRESL